MYIGGFKDVLFHSEGTYIDPMEEKQLAGGKTINMLADS